jgi:hypothetical protein
MTEKTRIGIVVVVSTTLSTVTFVCMVVKHDMPFKVEVKYMEGGRVGEWTYVVQHQ